MFSLDDDDELPEQVPAVHQRDAVIMPVSEPTPALDTEPVTASVPAPALTSATEPVLVTAEPVLATAEPVLATAAEIEPVPVSAAEMAPAHEAEIAPAHDAEMARAPDAEMSPATDAETALAPVAEVVPVRATDAQASAPEQPTEKPSVPAVCLVDRLREHPVDCFRCSQTGDGLWHTLPRALDFYRELFAVGAWPKDVGAEGRWYAVLERAGVVRGDECSSLRWPLTNTAARLLATKVHPVAQAAVYQLCWDAMAPAACEKGALCSFIEEVVAPSLLCLHEQARQRHTTLRIAEETLVLEDLRRGEIGSTADELHDLGGLAADDLEALSLMFSRAMSADVAAHMYCSVISAPSRGMQCAYQKTKRETPALTTTDGPTIKYVPVALSPPPLPEEALPIGLRRSIDSERTASKTAALSDASCASPRSIVARDYRTLFSDNNY